MRRAPGARVSGWPHADRVTLLHEFGIVGFRTLRIVLAPRLRALRVASALPLPGATPAARRSRFRGVPGKMTST
ncbi:MAG: hypothetical protein EOP79_09500 [Variovorax sp.]|uniref:Uncharacterized protein n=1 Tax=Variovorax guangxiensis TaxID=1775474 RepID=A0A502E094_9BURK|nr:MAG: hypothetical protein EOP79_09500 [Variovorax sp.]TPG26614.1 hypothetical protein EAH83_02270 [Variovorax ginsengisoli]TPG30339.1 hypothetical protein EAH82_02270 [Variovorax guangxiensis]